MQIALVVPSVFDDYKEVQEVLKNVGYFVIGHESSSSKQLL